MAHTLPRLSPFSTHPEKRFAERALLWYSPLWMAVIGALMATRCFARWGDGRFLLLGLGLALPPWLLALWRDRGRPGYLTKALLYITLLSLVQNYLGAALFFGGLGMRYHFPARLTLGGTPLFLYLVTIAYFCTYYVVLALAFRLIRGALRSTGLRYAALALCCYGVAFLETWVMANEAMRPFFSYADKGRTLLVGSLCYGTLFLCSLPRFYQIDEGERPTPLGQVLWEALGANLLIYLAYEVYLHQLLPRL